MRIISSYINIRGDRPEQIILIKQQSNLLIGIDCTDDSISIWKIKNKEKQQFPIFNMHLSHCSPKQADISSDCHFLVSTFFRINQFTLFDTTTTRVIRTFNENGEFNMSSCWNGIKISNDISLILAFSSCGTSLYDIRQKKRICRRD